MTNTRARQEGSSLRITADTTGGVPYLPIILRQGLVHIDKPARRGHRSSDTYPRPRPSWVVGISADTADTDEHGHAQANLSSSSWAPPAGAHAALAHGSQRLERRPRSGRCHWNCNWYHQKQAWSGPAAPRPGRVPRQAPPAPHAHRSKKVPSKADAKISNEVASTSIGLSTNYQHLQVP